ncbi:hypothetical protein LEP1GSC133_2954 [Leptospira borgpetersenii serovar Pomona str. 200901868]|uniref:Uncharacterized protein n=1 Tax=Leptospira borgpetersenii serovar Pomona str. 200901868 TaxID=1192866 RepID=M6WB68_LEPBO|nr:hypothetical protein LEP1GSC133_2954 [Leptospira borgpetersenii serovar Pomona str. 200901868]
MDSQRNLKKLGSPADFNIPKGLVPYLNRKIHDVGSLRLLLNQCIYKNGICYRFQSKFQEIGLVIKNKSSN